MQKHYAKLLYWKLYLNTNLKNYAASVFGVGQRLVDKKKKKKREPRRWLTYATANSNKFPCSHTTTEICIEIYINTMLSINIS